MSPACEPAGQAAGSGPVRVWLVDPSLFTGPYDAQLTRGLLAVGVRPVWATRPTRRGDHQEIPAEYTDPFFYRRVDEAPGLRGPVRAVAKGLAHAAGLLGLIRRVWRDRPDAVHVQWVVIPALDVLALLLIRLRSRVVLTVHDTVPFNGERISWLQNMGFDLPMRVADAVIVHTRAGRDRLIARGVRADKLRIIPHGPLPLHAAPAPRSQARDPRYTFVLFGEIKPYKGLDLLVEALARMPAPVRQRCRVIVAGRSRMDLAPVQQRIDELGLADTFDMRIKRLTEQEMADLFDEADAFVFPYRQIDASGVFHLVKGLGKPMLASRVGVFAEELGDDAGAMLVPPGDIDSLASALGNCLAGHDRPSVRRIAGAGWESIGAMTAALYRPSGLDGALRA